MTREKLRTYPKGDKMRNKGLTIAEAVDGWEKYGDKWLKEQLEKCDDKWPKEQLEKYLNSKKGKKINSYNTLYNTYEKAEERMWRAFSSEVKKLQKVCKHPKPVWATDVFPIPHDRKGLICLNCRKVLETKGRRG